MSRPSSRQGSLTWGFPKIRDPVFGGATIRRMLVGGSPIYGKFHINSRHSPELRGLDL